MAEADDKPSEAVKCLAEMSGEISQDGEDSPMVEMEITIENPRSLATGDHDYVEGADVNNHSHEKLDIISLPCTTMTTCVPVVGAVESVLQTARFSSPPASLLSSTAGIPQVVSISMSKYDQSWTNIGVWANPYKGYLSSNDELERAIKMYTEETDSRWVVTAKDKLFSSTDIKLGNFKLFWRGREDNRKAVFPDFDGIPFIMVGRKSWGCHLGRDKCRSGKIKYRTKMQDESQEGTDEKWPLIRSSKKLGCPGTLSGVHVLKFRDFPMSSNMSEFHRKQTLRRLRLSLMSKHSIVKAEQRFYINLSKPDEHIHETNPPQDSAAPTIRVDKRLIYKLTELYHSGVLRLADMNKEIEKYVKELFKDGELPSKEICPELYPSLNCLHFFISHAVKVTSLLEMDLGHCHRLVSGWQVEFPNDSWYYQPFASSGPIKRAKNKQNQRLIGHYPDMTQTFLFCCQNEGQRRLLHAYGSVCVLDSPHGKTILPTYFLQVRTNVGYQVVCTIIMQYWNSNMLVEAMQVIKDWNPDWQPKALLVEMIEDEVPVLEVLFPECQVLVSFIHRERAWLDFFSNEEDQCYDPVLLDTLFFARTKEEFDNALQALQECPLWTKNPRFQYWMRVRWLPCYQKWSLAFVSEPVLLTMCANNGLELLREALEYTWLENVRSRSLSELLTCLAMDELPKLYKSYTEENISMQAATRYQVNPKLPIYIRHQPVPVRQFINEVLSSMPSMQVVFLSEGLYLVNSEDSEEKHKVSFGTESEYPSCDCWTWRSKMKICEHFCAVFKQCPTWHWCKLSPLYTENVIFKVDQSQLDLDTPIQDTPRCGDHNAHTDILRHKEYIQVAMDDFGAEEVLEHDTSSNGDDAAADDDMDDGASGELELNEKQTTCNSLLERLGQMSKQVTDKVAMDFMTGNLVELLKQMQQYDDGDVTEKRSATPSSPDDGAGRKKLRSGPSPQRTTRQSQAKKVQAVSLSNNSPQKQLPDLELGAGDAEFTGDS